jgi:hypothetical protein
MEKIRTSKSLGFGGVAMVATAISAVVGAFAIGALAIGRLAIRRFSVGNARFRSFEIDDLTVTRLHVGAVTGDVAQLLDRRNSQ